MTDIRMDYQTDMPDGSFTTVDLSVSGVARMRITIADSHPAVASWVMYAANHTLPIPIGAFVRIWDADGADPGGNAYSSSNPLFEGHCQAPSPGDDANLIQYQAFDPTFLSQQKVNVMSAEWVEDGDGIHPADNSYPRIVFNATIQNDDDWALARAEGQSLSQIITTILDDQFLPLNAIHAAGGSSAYTSGDLSGMTFVPQEKQVFESENVRSAVERILQMEPSYRMLFRPGTRLWRFYSLPSATQVTLTLNDPDATNVVLSLSLQRSLEGRYTAVKIYGPERLTPAIASTVDGSLTIDTDSAVLLELLGSVEVNGYTRFQVTDAAKRKMARVLPSEIQVPVGSYNVIPVKSPTLQVSFDGGETWGSVSATYFDFNQGIVHTGLPVYYYTSEGRLAATGMQHYFPPDHYRLVYAYLDEPIYSRYPSSGYSGTAYSVANLANEMHLYDEMLAVGYNWFGTPVTTEERLAEFYKLATKIHSDRCNVIYTGGCTLQGLRYQFAHLNRRINFAAVDEDGDALTTGWEAIDAWLTDVEFDFENDLTTLQFSSDQLAMIGQDADDLKRRLKIRALEQRTIYTFNVTAGPVKRQYTQFGTGFLQGSLQGEASARVAYFDKQGNEVRT